MEWYLVWEGGALVYETDDKREAYKVAERLLLEGYKSVCVEEDDGVIGWLG